MTSSTLPAPMGTPQLVVTSKKAFIMDAHEPNKVLLQVRVPKEGRCCATNPNVTATEGNWTLVLVDNSTVYCNYNSMYAKAVWRSELLPRGQEGKNVTVLKKGYRPPFFPLETVMCVIALVLLTCYVSLLLIYLESKQSERFDAIKHLVAINVPGPPGQKGKDCTHVNLKSDFPILKSEEQSPPPKAAAISSKNTDYLLTTDTLRPGQELKTGESRTLGKYHLAVIGCAVHVTDKNQQLWAAYNSNRSTGPCILSMQHDGNLVLYQPGIGAAWSLREHSDVNEPCLHGVTTNQNGRLLCQIK